MSVANPLSTIRKRDRRAHADHLPPQAWPAPTPRQLREVLDALGRERQLEPAQQVYKRALAADPEAAPTAC